MAQTGATVVALSHLASSAKPGKTELEIVRVTPQMAQKMLELNGLNRPLRSGHAEYLASQIKAGKWKFNGDTIKIADTEDVLDGQHRLWAIVTADMPVYTVVVRGIKKDAFSTIDTGRSVRTPGDVIALAGQRKYRNVVASALGWLLRWQKDAIVTYKSAGNKLDNADIEAAFAAHPRMVQAAERAQRLRGLANVSIMAFLYYILANRDPELAERMMDTLEDPTGVGINDPFFRLRAYFTTDHHKSKDPIMTIALALKAINAANRRQSVQKLTWRNQGSRVEDFPFLDV